MAETEKKPRRYKFKEVCIRLEEGSVLYSERSMNNPERAVDVMRDEMSQYDREMLCVVNLNSKMKPINFNIVSIGTIDQAPASIPNIFKSGILSNASAFMLMHNHPSGDPTPSMEDIALTERVVRAGHLMGIPCVDHIVIGCRTGDYYSMRENDAVSFDQPNMGRTAETSIVGDYGKESTMAENTKAMDPVAEVAAEAMEAAAAGAAEAGKDAGKEVEEISLKFGKGLAEPFTAKDGKEYMRILIPNQDASDHTPWASFVLPAKSVHENQFGKGLWAKIPADGHTTVTKPERVGTREDGKGIWEDRKSFVPNRELKGMVEAYKSRDREASDRESVIGKLDGMKQEASKPAAEKSKPKAKTKPKAKSTEPTL